MIDSTLKNAKILIVDDQLSNIDILTSFLEIVGYTNLLTTTDPRMTVELCKSFTPDLILLDLVMPNFSGYEVLEQLNGLIGHSTYLPVLVLTADISVLARQRALSGGARDFISKPFDLVEVDLRIKNLLETRYLHQQLENHNHILEERINERTIELEKSNRDLLWAKEKAETSDRLKTAFLRNISHEIRTPLNGILGFGTRLAKRNLSQEKKDEYFAVLQLSTDRLANTMTNYLDMAQIVSGNLSVHKTEFELAKLLNEIYVRFAPSCEAKDLFLFYQHNAVAEDFKIYTDRNILVKILVHLIDNAVKFTNHGTITYGFEVKRDELEFFVQDTGTGIEEEAKTLIFEHFMQEDVSTTRRHEGSGLGLSISNKMAEGISGRMWFQSVKNKGSIFYFTIPYLKKSPESAGR